MCCVLEPAILLCQLCSSSRASVLPPLVVAVPYATYALNSGATSSVHVCGTPTAALCSLSLAPRPVHRVSCGSVAVVDEALAGRVSARAAATAGVRVVGSFRGASKQVTVS